MIVADHRKTAETMCQTLISWGMSRTSAMNVINGILIELGVSTATTHGFGDGRTKAREIIEIWNLWEWNGADQRNVAFQMARMVADHTFPWRLPDEMSEEEALDMVRKSGVKLS